MQTGEVYKWATTQARSHQTRNKYHIFICEHPIHQNVFLFINSENLFNQHDFEIVKSDCPFLPNPSSFISCTNIVCYEHREIIHLVPSTCVGQLTVDCMTRLASHLAGSHTMASGEINIVCSALNAVI